MIRAFVDYSLRNKLLVLAVGVLLLAWGAISFKNLPVEAYPDVANNYVQVITQWPGRAGEEVEQQVTIPIEVQMSRHPSPRERSLHLGVRLIRGDHEFR